MVSLLRQKKNLNGGAEIRDCDPSGDIVKTIDTLIDYVGYVTGFNYENNMIDFFNTNDGILLN